METCSQPNYETVEKFLRNYSTAEGPFDFNGLLHLILAGVDNLRANFIEQDFEEYGWVISEEQAEFLQRLLEARPRSQAMQEKQ